MPSFKVPNQSDARPWHFQELLKSNGSRRIVVFPGCISDRSTFTRYQKLGTRLAKPESFFSRYSSQKGREGLGIELLTVHSAPRTRIELLGLNEVYHPFSGTDGWDYNKVFVDDQSWHEGHGHAYEGYGIDPRPRLCCDY
jgi:phenol 2-monooxygenase (NADPH)